MPRGDGTGPAGLGPMTGRSAGYCAGYPIAGYRDPILGRGFGPGFGRGLGFGRGGGRGRRCRAFQEMSGPLPEPPYYYNEPHTQFTAQEERTLLENQVNRLQNQLDGIKQRLEELAEQKEKKE